VSGENGDCDICRSGWDRGERPPLVGRSFVGQALVYRCEHCGTYWEMTERYAAPITLEDAKSTYSDLDIHD
jgi:hypothetical protein